MAIDSTFVTQVEIRQLIDQRVRDAMKFVKVATDDGYLTDISIAMILVELRRSGLAITFQ